MIAKSSKLLIKIAKKIVLAVVELALAMLALAALVVLVINNNVVSSCRFQGRL